MEYIKEIMSNEFSKYHVKGLPFHAIFHHFTDVDKGGAHDHPWAFTTYILKGGYIERVYIIESGQWRTEDIYREPGSVHAVKATHIHEIIALPQGECWTLVIPEQTERDSKFWRFSENGISFRVWYEKDFTPFKK